MTTPRTLARLDTLIWTLIFGGLLLVVLGVLVVVRAELRDGRALAGSGEPGVQAA